MMEKVYRLEGVSKSYAGRKVLQIPELEIFSGEIFGVVGPSGSGKSTLLRLLNFLEPPTEGRILFRGMDFNGREPPLEVMRKITMVFQRPLLLEGSVEENVAYGLLARGVRNAEAKVKEMLRKLDLEGMGHLPARKLSGGEAQRVALARALVLEPEVLLLDEPTANLDPGRILMVEEIIREVNRSGTTIVLVTHNIFQARRLAHRIAFLLNGELVEVAPTGEFFSSPSDPRTAAFISGIF